MLGSAVGSWFLLASTQACVVNTTDGSGGAAGYSSSVGGSTSAGLGGSTAAGAGGTTAGSAGSVTAGSGGTTGGSAGSVTAGSGGTSTAGAAGSTTAGAGGTATAGSGGSTAGAGGTVTAGAGGTAAAGSGGSATAGAGGTGTAGSGTAGSGGTGAGGATATCFVRIAHLACDTGNYGDVCFKPSGVTSWTDPKVTQLFKVAGDPQAFYYPAVSVYFEIDEGQYDVRYIDAGASCATPYDAPFDHTTIDVKPGAHYTLALEGELTKHDMVFHLIADTENPTNGTVGFQALNALTQTTGDLNFCLQEPVNQGINTVTTGLVKAPNGPAKDQDIPQSVPTVSSGGPAYSDERALMFLDNQDSKTYAISNYRRLHPNEQYFAFVAGTSLTDPEPNFLPQVISCLYDTTNAGTASNPTIAASCDYYQQTVAPPAQLAARFPRCAAPARRPSPGFAFPYT